MTSDFIKAMDEMNHLQLGENGSAEYTSSGVGNSLVALFFALVRDIPAERLQDLLRTALKEGKDDAEVIADLFIMGFQTRNCRGGKGERDLFYHMIMELGALYPQTTASLMVLVPHYGTFKDWFRIIEWSRDEDQTALNPKARREMRPVINAIMNLARDQLISDRHILDKGKSTREISLLAKWAPREGKGMDALAKELANKVFPNSKAPKKEYRQLLSRLNAAINTIEIKMSNNEWDRINFSKGVPSVSLMKYRKAFLNELVEGQPPRGDEDETGNRHPGDERRVKCRKRLRETMEGANAAKLKGRQLFPHEVVQKLMNGAGQLSTLEKDIFSHQWNDIRKSVQEAMEKLKAGQGEDAHSTEDSSAAVDLGKVVSLVDVSGSMYGTPIKVAIALGLLVSEIASPAYGNRCLTFSAEPSWVEFHQNMSLEEKVHKMKGAPWGMNTNFEAATEKILQVAVNAKLSPGEIPDLIVFSDMQFDEARSSYGQDRWETHHQRIVRRFAKEGIKACGKEWPAPHIIYWNLRGNTSGFPAQVDTPGVTLLSGFSPSLMKLLLSGEAIEDEEEVVDKDNVKRKKMKQNPYATLRKALDSEDYDRVREILHASEEDILRNYVKKVDSDMLVVTEEVEEGYEMI